MSDDTITRQDIYEAIRELRALVCTEFVVVNDWLTRIEHREHRESLDIAALTARVEAETSLDESIKVLIEGIVADDPALAELTEKLRVSNAALVAAVKANT